MRSRRALTVQYMAERAGQQGILIDNGERGRSRNVAGNIRCWVGGRDRWGAGFRVGFPMLHERLRSIALASDIQRLGVLPQKRIEFPRFCWLEIETEGMMSVQSSTVPMAFGKDVSFLIY